MKLRSLTLAAIFVYALSGTLAAQLPTTPSRPGGNGAPTAIMGTVSDSTNKPLAGAAVTVKTGTDAGILTGALTDSKGKFRIEGLAPGKYHLHVSYIGYKSQLRDVELTPQVTTANVGPVVLPTDVIAVQGLTASALRSNVTVGVDRNIYSTKNMPAATGGNATDLLRNVPELDVDADGNVKLQGSQSVALHINGRPAPMRGDALKNFLQMLPANRVDRVEIIPNPSAKYDPEGIAGIVNIVMKDNLDLGFSGSVGAGIDSRGRNSANLGLNYQKGKLTLFGNTSLNLNAATMNLTDERKNLLATPVTFFSNHINNDMNGHFVFFDGSAEYRLSKLNTAYTSARINRASQHMVGLQVYQILDSFRNPMLWNDWNNNNRFSFANADVAVGLRRVVKAQQNELTGEVRYNNNEQTMHQEYIKDFLTATGAPTSIPDENGLTNSNNDLGEYSLKVDYTRQLNPKVKLETGFKGALRGTDYKNLLERFTGTATSPFDSERSDFQYDENYQQAYALVTRQMGKLGVQAGGRGELASTDFKLPSGTDYANDYHSFFPSANVSYTKDAQNTARLSYSKRLDRPQPNMLNPGQPSADSLNKFVGNPLLKPKYTHTFTADFTHMANWGMIKFAPYYRNTVNNWDMFKVVDATGASTLTWKNTNSVKAYGANTTLQYRAGSKGTGFVSFNAYQFKRDATSISSAYSGDGFRWDVSANATATLRKGLLVQAFGRYQGAQDMPQGKISPAVFTNLGLRQQLMNNKAALNVSLSDPFNVFRFKFETADATHIQNSENKVSIRALRVGFNYNFGKPPTPTVRKENDQQQQTDQTTQIR